MSPAFERIQQRPRSFLSAVLAFAWLEYRALRHYPANLVLSVIQGLVKTGSWFFIARFISGAADRYVTQSGGNYVSFVITGVVFYEAGAAALNSPLSAISTAFWEKRLEGYHLTPRGIWAYILGRFLWQWGYATALQATVLVLIASLGGLGLAFHVQPGMALLAYLLFVAAVFGIGLMGSSLFFLLEVKQGREPVSWLVDYAVRITSGVYIPVAALPAWLRGLGAILPHTYGLHALRGALFPGGAAPGPDLAILAAFACATLAGGVVSVQAAIRRAERQGGVGVVV
ncbi:MAG TPA: ABC transporter permease [Symbiobacteriaceae bacterium]|jgi:ABC-2 type transport system permease protein